MNLEGLGSDIRIEAVKARFQGLASQRAGRAVKLKSEKQARRLVEACDSAGLHPCKLVEWTFDLMGQADCLGVFGIPYPPIEYTYSHYNLTKICALYSGEKQVVTSGIAAAVSKAISSEYMSGKISSHALSPAIVAGTLHPIWVRAVCCMKQHPLHQRVKAITEAFNIEMAETLNEAEIEHVIDCLRETLCHQEKRK